MSSLVAASVLSLFVGAVLGLLGGGGAILTLPILVYVLGIDEKVAIATSLFVVGVTSAIAVLPHARAGRVVLRVAVPFAGAGMVGAFMGGRLARFVAADLLLLGFAVVMFAAAYTMWRGRAVAKAVRPKASPWLSAALIVAQGLAVGLVSGLVGAGGGFLIVPALAIWGGLAITQAVGSSLVVIALNSFAGFLGYASHVHVDYDLAAVVTSAAIVGSLGGAYLAPRVPAIVLRKTFAGLVAVVASVLVLSHLPTL